MAVILLGCSSLSNQTDQSVVDDHRRLPLAHAPLISTHMEYYFHPQSNPEKHLDIDRNLPLGKLQLFKANTSYAQRFFFITAGQDRYRIVKGQQYSHLLVKTENNTVIPYLSEDISNDAGLWQIVPSGETGYYYIISDLNGKALSVGKPENMNESITLKELTGSADQKWQLSPVGN